MTHLHIVLESLIAAGLVISWVLWIAASFRRPRK